MTIAVAVVAGVPHANRSSLRADTAASKQNQ